MLADFFVRSFLTCCGLILLTEVADTRGGGFLSTRFSEDGNGHGRYYPILPYNAEGDDTGPSARNSAPLTYAERESARGDTIVSRVKRNHLFAQLPLQELQRGPEPVREAFSAHLIGHVQARLFAGGSHAAFFYDSVVQPKMWQFTAQHFTPILRRRVDELRMNLPETTPEGASVIKNHIRSELPTFEEHDRAMQGAVDQEVEAARQAAIAAKDPHPELAAERRLKLVTGWRLKRSEYGGMVYFVDRSIDDILADNPAPNTLEAMFEHLHITR